MKLSKADQLALAAVYRAAKHQMKAVTSVRSRGLEIVKALSEGKEVGK